MIHLDTTFLVDLLREGRTGRGGAATEFLAARSAEELGVSLHAVCELFAGIEAAPHPEAERDRVERLLAVLPVVHPDERLAPVYGRLVAQLDRAGSRIGVMDLLIGASALVHGASLVTRNVREFSRIPGLCVLTY